LPLAMRSVPEAETNDDPWLLGDVRVGRAEAGAGERPLKKEKSQKATAREYMRVIRRTSLRA
jgi:hypothetical protein